MRCLSERSTPNFPTVHYTQGKSEEADVLYLRAIEIKEKALGLDHPRLAISLCHRAEMLAEQVIHLSRRHRSSLPEPAV